MDFGAVKAKLIHQIGSKEPQLAFDLPEGAKIVKVYNAFENGELRVVVQFTNGYQTRYIVHFEGEGVRLEHRP